MTDFEIPPYQTFSTEKEQIEILLQDDFPVLYFSVHSATFIAIGLIELVLMMISKADFGPVSDIGHSLISASILVVLGILSILLSNILKLYLNKNLIFFIK